MRELKKRTISHFCIRLLIGTLTVLISSVALSDQIETTARFRLHLVEEPGRILPEFKDRFTGQYLIGNLFEGYYKINGNDELRPALMKRCDWKSETQLICQPAKRKWSNGRTILPADYFEHLKRQLERSKLSAAKEVMADLLNYEDYLKGRKEFSEVGLKLNKAGHLIFELKKADRDFLYSLSHGVLSPIPNDPTLDDQKIATDYATGPYKLKSWTRGRSILLERNLNHPQLMHKAPLVEFFFIAEYFTALNLYESGKLDFLRRFPLENLERFQGTPQLIQQKMHRFDYLGFGPKLRPLLELRQALQTSFDGIEFQRLQSSPGPVGCVSISSKLQSGPYCLKQKKHEKLEIGGRISLHFAKQAGENVARGMQWFQAQWQKNLGIRVDLVSEDWKYLESKLKDDAPDIFRKGVPLSRPTCLAALEVFESGSPDNYIKFENKKYDELVAKMRSPKLAFKKLPSLCSQGIKLLLDSALLIPQGEMAFYMLTNGKFRGFTVNSLNQLDLAGLIASQ